MLAKFFSFDNPVWRVVLKIGQIWLLNILWLVTSVPVFTIGASTTALIYACMKLQNDEGYPASNYLHSFADNFRQATVLWLIYAAVGALLAGGLIFWNQTDRSSLKPGWALVIALAIPYVLSLLYVFAVQSRFVNTVKDTMHYAIILSIKHFKYTFQMLLLFGVVIYLNVTTILWVNYLTLTVGVGLIAYLCSLHYAKIFETYIPAQEDTPE